MGNPVVHNEDIGAAVGIGERGRHRHRPAECGICGVELQHFDHLLVRHELQLRADGGRELGNARRVAFLIALGRLDVESEDFERREIRVLQVAETCRALLGESSDHISRQNQEAAPRDQCQHRVLGQAGIHSQTARRLEEEDECRDEQTGDHGKPPATIEAGEDDRQIIEAEKRDLLLDQGIDDEQRGDEQEDEDALEVLQHEPPNHKTLSAKEIGRSGPK